VQRVPSEKWDSDRTLASQALATPALAISGLCGTSSFRIVEWRSLASARENLRDTAAVECRADMDNMQRAERFSLRDAIDGCRADQIRADSTPVDVSDDTGTQPLASPLISPITLAFSDDRLGLLASIRAE
jgi:hypothetical protein